MNKKKDSQTYIHCNQFEYEKEKANDHREFDLMKMIIINHESNFIVIWKLLDIFFCLVSSWIYMWLTVFSIEGVDTRFLEYYSHYIELFFLITIILGFITDFKKPGEHVAEKKLSVISKRYLKQDFLLDFIPIIPIPDILISISIEHKVSYFIKVIRFHKG